jgi:dynein heavy chain
MEETYNTTPFVSLKKDDINQEVNAVFNKAAEILALKIAGTNTENLVARNMMDKIENYQKILPHILALANPAIKPRHWTKLFEAVGQPYDEDTIFSLVQLREYGILAQEDIIKEISTVASGEYELETTLENIETTWNSMTFKLIPYHNKSKNIYILTGVEEIQQLVEDHEITLTTMLSSEYVAGIRKVGAFYFVVC